MFPRIFLRFAWAALALGYAPVGLAQTPASATSAQKISVEARSVGFSLVNPPGSNLKWFEADVIVDARVVGGRSAFVDRVRVSLTLGTRVLGGTYRFYQAEMEAVTLENGPAHFRFYLPAEVVKRDGLGGEPEFWSVKITVAGEAQAFSSRQVSASLREGERRKNFEARIASEAPANAGVLLPQHLTPFATAYPLATPTPVRRAPQN